MPDEKRSPKVPPLPPEVSEALPRLVERHVPGHPLRQVLALPGAGAAPGRRKYFVRLEGMDERPLLLTVYPPGEARRIENSLAAARALATRRAAPGYHVIAADAEARTAPFPYRLATFLWGTDAGSLLASGAVGAEEARAIGEAIGDALGGLHGVEGEGFGEARLGVEERFDALSEAIVMTGAAADPYVARLVVEAGEALDAGGGMSRLVHGGLSLASCIVRIERGRYEMSGFVGLGGALWFDPVFDLVSIEEDLARFPLAREPLMKAYLARRPIFADLEAKRPVMRRLVKVARGG